MTSDQRTGIIRSVTAPLGFFVLALLIAEAFLGTVLIGAKIDASLQLICVWAGILMFVGVVLLVFILVWFKPMNLVFDKDSALEAELGRVS